jgi:hypothetical protein
MVSFRLKFIDIDSSYTAPVVDSTVKGFFVVRAPKGNAQAVYFGAGSTEVIESMIGVGTAHWTDINEAVIFNKEYGCWISAPAGTSKEYPSYFGGIYLTKHGVFPFYQVQDKEEPNFLTAIVAGSEPLFQPSFNLNSSYMEITTLSDTKNTVKTQGVLNIKEVSNQVISSLSKLELDYWGNGVNGCPQGKIHLVLENLLNGHADIKYITSDGVPSQKPIGEAIQNTQGTWDFTLGAGAGNADTSDIGYPLMFFENILDYNNLYNDDPANPGTWILPANIQDELKDILVVGGSKLIQNGLVQLAAQGVQGIGNKIKWIVTIKDDTYMYITQKGMTEKVTNVEIRNIGYDKYFYDLALQYVVDAPKVGFTVNPDHPEGLFIVLNASGATFLDEGLYQKDASGNINNVTEEYMTKYIKLYGSLDGNTNFINDLKYIEKIGSTCQLKEVGLDKPIKPVLNNKFNSITFAISEEVYPGSLMGGGEFTGSLSEDGKDTYGSNIYWPNVLPDDAMSFVEVVPVKSLDGDLDAKGFFKYTRIVDLLGPEPDLNTSYIKGNRFISKLIQENIDKNLTGSVWDERMGTVLNEGWNTAFMPKYDEAHIFVEPTGWDGLKGTLQSLRSVQKLSTVISPKIITKAEFLNPDKIIVAGRMTGTAQYVGEFLMKCPYTQKKYWICPIGDVAVNLARIIDLKMGGWSPMWTNVTGGLGGQLGRAVLEAKWDFDDKAQEKMDKKSINPIILDSTYGLMITSGKTTQDPNNPSDWSYLGHSMSFDLCKREVREGIMVPQIGKPINDYYMNLRKEQLQEVLDKRTSGSQPIWNAAKGSVKEVNNGASKAARTFKLKAKVQVTPFSDFVEFEFENVSQTVVLS